MKFEEMYIEANKEQKPIVCKILEDNGFRSRGDIIDISASDDSFISTYSSGKYGTYPEALFGTILTFEEFMQRYLKNEMIKKIHQAKKELGLNNSELSLKMGKSRPYIAKMLNQPQSEKVQNKVIAELDKLIDGKNYAQAIEEEVKPLIKSVKNTSNTLWNEILDGKDKEIADLKKIIESKDLAISGLIKQNDEAKKIHDQDEKTIKYQSKDYADLSNSMEQAKRELDYFVNQYNQSELVVNSLKSKIKRERIIILIVIVILTALFFLKGSIGG
ncbi:putative transcriptional regulator [Acinetobacter phage vB_AbaM_BP10]|nr:putative transcriptional regulator [Acinetobacter phage vB_AbaM_BP10]